MRIERDDNRVELGVAWYRPDQWDELLRIAPDAKKLERTYEEWREFAANGIKALEQGGVKVSKIDVDLAELVEWCDREGRQPDADSRAAFGAERLRLRH
jgi:hypothetical protein